MDDRIYNDYMTESERSILADNLFEAYDLDRYFCMLEMVDTQLDINMRKAELKVLQENGTYEDLEYLYEEAEAQAQEQKKGIIQSIVSAITGAFQAIINGIRKFFKLNNSDPNRMVEVDQQAWEASQKLGSEWDKVSSQIDGDPNDENHWKTVVPKLLAGVLGATAIIAGGKYAAKKIKVRAEDQEKQGDKITAICQKIVEISKKFTDSKFFNFVKTPFEKLKNGIKSILDKIGIKFNGKKDEAENSEESDEGAKGKSFTNTDSDKAKNDKDYQDFKNQQRENKKAMSALNGTVFNQAQAAKNARSIDTTDDNNKNILPFIRNGAVNQIGIVNAIKSGEIKEKDIDALFKIPFVRDDKSINRSDGVNYKINTDNLTTKKLNKLIANNQEDNFNPDYLKYLCMLSNRLRERGELK